MSPSATCWPCMKRSRASPGSLTSAFAATSPRQNLPASAASRSEGPSTAICSFTGMATLYALSASCLGPEICRAGCWKSRKADRGSLFPVLFPFRQPPSTTANNLPAMLRTPAHIAARSAAGGAMQAGRQPPPTAFSASLHLSPPASCPRETRQPCLLLVLLLLLLVLVLPVSKFDPPALFQGEETRNQERTFIGLLPSPTSKLSRIASEAVHALSEFCTLTPVPFAH